MKSCLKSGQPTPASSPGPEGHGPSTNTVSCKQKCVAFCNGQQVWEADEWDRTPHEPARNLSYQDLLELKEIQKSLPRAPQPIDLRASRPFANQYLSKVPVGLLPLLQDDEPCTIHSSPNPYSPRRRDEYHAPEQLDKSPPVTYSAPSALFPHGFAMKHEKPPSPLPVPPRPTLLPPPPPQQPQQQSRQQQHAVPSHLSHLLPPKAAPQPRRQSTFTFLPLLEPPTPKVEEDPPTPSLTNASLDSSPNPSPRSQASDLPDTPPADPHSSFYFPAIEDHHDQSLPPVVAFKRIGLTPLPPPPPPSSTLLSSSLDSPPEQHVKVEAKRRKKQVIYINDMEVELDEDEPEGAPCSPSSSSSSPSSLASLSPIQSSPAPPPRFIHGFQFLPVNGSSPAGGNSSPPSTPVSSPLSRMGCMRGSPPPTGSMGFIKSS